MKIKDLFKLTPFKRLTLNQAINEISFQDWLYWQSSNDCPLTRVDKINLASDASFFQVHLLTDPNRYYADSEIFITAGIFYFNIHPIFVFYSISNGEIVLEKRRLMLNKALFKNTMIYLINKIEFNEAEVNLDHELCFTME